MATAIAATNSALPSTAHAQELPAGVTRGVTVEGITEYTLDNGLRVLLFPDQSRQRITVNITYLVGSRHESYGETGMAHLLEHLVFKGTPNHPDIPQELTEHGALPNGTTWFDRTNYFETFPATEENLAWALDLEADRMVNSFIAKEDLESEMTVVRNEWEMGENSPFRVLQKRVQSTAFQWHNYGNSTIGARADIENVPIERLQAFYRNVYQPYNAIVFVAGRFDEGTALELIAEKFGAISRPERSGTMKLWPTYTAEPAQDGERTVTLRRVGDVQLAMAAYHVPAGSHEDYPAVQILSHVLGNEPSGRLYKALVEPGLAASTGSFSFQLREPGGLMALAQVRLEDSLDEATEAMLRTIDEVIEDPPTEEEVERARTQYLSNIDLLFRTTQRIALSVSEWASMGDWRLFFLHRDRLKDVTQADVARVAEAYFKPSNRTIGFFIPAEEEPLRAEIPAIPDVATLVADYTGGEAVAEGETFDPTPANVEARTTRFELPSGFEVAFLPKENRGETVVMTAQLRFGTEEALMGKRTAAELAAEMLGRGTSTMSREDIRDEFARLKAQVNSSGGVTSSRVTIQTVRENLPEVMRLLGNVMKDPVFDEGEFELLREEQLAQLENQMSEPTAKASVEFGRHMNPWPEGHPEYTPTLDEAAADLKAVTVEEARSFYGSFYGAQGGTMAVVGDFDSEEIRPLVEEIFGDWTGEEAYVRFDRPFRDVEPLEKDIETPDKSNAFMIAGMPLEMRDDHPDYPALVLGNYMLGGGFLNSRLATRIRQQEGLSYGVGSQFQVNSLDERGVLVAFAIYAPENADKVVEAFRDEIGKMLETGFTAEEVEAAIAGYLDRVQNIRSSDNTLATQLANNLFLDRSMEFTAQVEAAISKLTPEAVNEAMRRWVDPARWVIIRAGDFAGAKEAT
jgi:zinc protease